MLDRLPHHVYAAQHRVSILNPSAETFELAAKPLLDEAHTRLARQQAASRRSAGRPPQTDGPPCIGAQTPGRTGSR